LGGAGLSVQDGGGRDLDGVKFRLETYDAGNGYVGGAAAEDGKWVKDVYETLRDAWLNDRRGYVDY